MPSVSNPLQQAVFRGCVECIRMLVESPPFYNVDASCGPEGLRPIHIAAREGHIQTLRFLKTAGACLQKSDVNGFTALHHAAITGQLRAVRWLLRHGAKISLDKQGRSPIQVATDHDHMEIVSVLAKHATSGTTSGATSSGATGSNGSHREPNLSLPVTVNLDQYTTPSNANGNGHSNGHREKSRDRSRERSRERSSNGTTITVNSNGGNIIKTTVSSSGGGSAHKSRSEDPKVFVPPPPPPPPPAPGVGGSGATTTDCASSSGNSSLSASTNTPSLSPSASSTSNSSTTSCGCPVSSSDSSSEELKSATETTHSFTLTNYREISPEGTSKDSSPTSTGSSTKSFFLHPPKTNGVSNSPPGIQFPSTQQSNGNSGGSGSSGGVNGVGGGPSSANKKHSRQPSTCVTGPNSPFFLHPPGDLVSETKAAASKMAPAPVNPSHGHHHIQDLINETHSQSKVKGGMGLGTSDFSSNSASSVSSGSSPPPTPVSQKTGFGIGCTVSALQGKFQQISNGNNKDDASGQQNNNHNFEVHMQNSINSGGIKNGAPPPPPPPPMPGCTTDMNNNLVGHHDNGLHEPDKRNGDGTQVENDYEDIDELTNGDNHFETLNKKLVRTTSCPPPPPPFNEAIYGQTGHLMHNHLNNNHSSTNEERSQITPTKTPHGCGRPGVPFIPPHFPTPPQDALIKPSEYLRSIQNKGKTNGATNGTGSENGAQNGQTVPTPRPLSKVEEAIKALGVAENHVAVMSPVPEETNAEDEFEEINPERINGISNNIAAKHAINNSRNDTNNINNSAGSNGTITNGADKSCGKENKREPIYAAPGALGIVKGCGAVIKPEELMKVHLKKTPMSRTRSAPPLGRVVPDNHQTLGPTKSVGKANGDPMLLGNEPLRKSNTALNGSTSNLSATGETTTKAAVIAELAESSQVGGVREWKEELRRRQQEEEKAVQKELSQYYQPVNFYAEVPAKDMTGAPIPAWKRQMMAKKAAERARKEAEEQRKLEIEAKRMASIPLWRRQLLQRRESSSDGKYAQ